MIATFQKVDLLRPWKFDDIPHLLSSKSSMTRQPSKVSISNVTNACLRSTSIH